jgi:hypothetical protein
MSLFKDNAWVYDLEQFPNFHSGIFYNINTGEYREFVIHKSRNDIKEYIKFLESCDVLIGFNNINYDYPLLHYLLTHKHCSVEELYRESQRIIKELFPAIKMKNVLIKQVDLFRIWHFNNKARMTSLKKLQVAMRWKKVQDLPLHYTSFIKEEQIPEILKYNKNDVDSTYQFFIESKQIIKLREDISETYNIDVINKSDAGMGEDIFASSMSKALNVSMYDLKQLRTHRDTINFNDCILPYVKYASEEFSTLLNKLKNTIISETKGSIKDSVIYKGFKYDFGTGKLN